jgi:hypothetical protein
MSREREKKDDGGRKCENLVLMVNTDSVCKWVGLNISMLITSAWATFENILRRFKNECMKGNDKAKL